jgi:CBS domain-containing protein
MDGSKMTTSKIELEKSVGEYAQKKLITIDEGKSSVDAGKIMQENRVGSLVVTRYDRPVGIITERDLVYKVVAQKLDPSFTPVKSIMSSPIKTIESTAKVGDALATMSKNKIRRLAVVKEGKIIGLVSQRSIVSDNREEQVLLPELEKPGVKRCPYCDQEVSDAAELSKHIDYVHIGKGLLEGDMRRW